MRNTIENIETENSFGTEVLRSSTEKNTCRIHSLSTTATSSDIITFDTKSLMNLELSSQSTCSTSWGASAPSCIQNNLLDLDMKDAMACPLIEVNSMSHDEVCNSDTGELRKFKKLDGIKVLTKGTTLMASIGFPTVIIKMDRKKLHNSMLYYIVLEPHSRHNVEKIVCLMFSSADNRENTIQTAELLPLRMIRSERCPGGVSLVPMLRDNSNRSLFDKGSTFIVKSIEQGRRLNQNARKWKEYDIKKSEISQLLGRLLYLDISQMPIYIFDQLKPSNAKEVTQSVVPVKQEFHLRHKMMADPQIRCRPILRQDARPRSRAERCRSSFAQFLNTANHTYTGGDFVGHIKPALRLDDMDIKSKLNTYVSLSRTI